MNSRKDPLGPRLPSGSRAEAQLASQSPQVKTRKPEQSPQGRRGWGGGGVRKQDRPVRSGRVRRGRIRGAAYHDLAGRPVPGGTGTSLEAGRGGGRDDGGGTRGGGGRVRRCQRRSRRASGRRPRSGCASCSRASPPTRPSRQARFPCCQPPTPHPPSPTSSTRAAPTAAAGPRVRTGSASATIFRCCRKFRRVCVGQRLAISVGTARPATARRLV